MATEKKQQSVFATLNAIDLKNYIEKKKDLTYISWSNAWLKVKENYPDAFYTIYENADGYNYHTDGKTCWVKTGVTINGLEHIEYLPVMDYKNTSIPIDKVTSFDVNKSIQRSLTKACARHGLGLYIYAGEDLPENAKEEEKEKQKELEEAFAILKPEIATAASKGHLMAIHEKNPQFHDYAPYKTEMNKRFKEL